MRHNGDRCWRSDSQRTPAVTGALAIMAAATQTALGLVAEPRDSLAGDKNDSAHPGDTRSFSLMPPRISSLPSTAERQKSKKMGR